MGFFSLDAKIMKIHGGIFLTYCFNFVDFQSYYSNDMVFLFFGK